MNRRAISVALLLAFTATLVAVLYRTIPYTGRGGDRSAVLSLGTDVPEDESPTPIAEYRGPLPTMPAVMLTIEPYPPPLPDIVTPSPSRTPDPTRAAMTATDWANRIIAMLDKRDPVNALHEGPFVLVDARDVYPSSMPMITDKILMRGVVPDVAAVIRGTFRQSPRGPGRKFMLIVGDRGDDYGYTTVYSDDVQMLTSMLP
ncbi:MAG: hypothetical protein U0470_03485 [Anaerolineae bacterium]